MLHAFKNKTQHARVTTRSRAALANVTNAAAVPAALTASKPRVKRQLKVRLPAARDANPAAPPWPTYAPSRAQDLL